MNPPTPPSPAEETLKPCPFCKAIDVLVETCLDNNRSWCSCEGCGACGPREDTEREAVLSWNTRAAQPSKEAETLEIQKAVTLKTIEVFSEVLRIAGAPLNEHGDIEPLIEWAESIREAHRNIALPVDVWDIYRQIEISVENGYDAAREVMTQLENHMVPFGVPGKLLWLSQSLYGAQENLATIRRLIDENNTRAERAIQGEHATDAEKAP